jgi:hypothetical protein
VPDASPLDSPAAVFPGLGINASRRAACVFLLGLVARNGLSLTRNGCLLSKASIPRSSFPACYFARPPVGPTARSAFWLHNHLDRRSCLPSRLLRRLRPVAVLSERFGKLLRTTSAPPTGFLSPPGINAFNRSGCLPARLMKSPDYPSLPVAASISRFGFGSSFLARYSSTG